MKELITLIDSNHHLLHNHIFLSMCWNMIRAYSPGVITSFPPFISVNPWVNIESMSYFSKLKVPHSSYFSFLINNLDRTYLNNNYLDFLITNPGLISRKEHIDLYNLIYYKETKCDYQADFFFNNPPPLISTLNLRDHEFYHLSFDCNALHHDLNNRIHPFFYNAFKYKHPFFLFDSNGDTLKLRVITHNIPEYMGQRLPCTTIGTYNHPIKGVRTSYAVDIGYEVPKSFIKKVSHINIYNRLDQNIYINFLNNKYLVTMPKEIINPFQLSVYGKFNYNESIIDCYENTNINSSYNSSLNELKQNIKLTSHFQYKSEQILNKINTNELIHKKWIKN